MFSITQSKGGFTHYRFFKKKVGVNIELSNTLKIRQMKFLKLIILLFFTSTIFSQVNNNSEIKPFIEVVGTAETEIIPNEIYVNITLKERIEKGDKLTIQFLENQLKEQLIDVGIPKENLFISDVNAVLAKTGWFTEEVLSIANYSLKVNGADKLKQLFECFKKFFSNFI